MELSIEIPSVIANLPYPVRDRTWTINSVYLLREKSGNSIEKEIRLKL